jgi:serralysin
MAGGGIDTVRASASEYVLGDNVENLIYTGACQFSRHGKRSGQRHHGRRLRFPRRRRGSGQADRRRGQRHYVIDSRATVYENTGGGTDTVLTSLTSYALGANPGEPDIHRRGHFTGGKTAWRTILTGGGGDDRLTGGGRGHVRLHRPFRKGYRTDFTVSGRTMTCGLTARHSRIGCSAGG